MPVYRGAGKTAAQPGDKLQQSRALFRRAGIARSSAVFCQTAHIAHAYGLRVMPRTMGSGPVLGTARLHLSVRKHNIMVPHPVESAGTVPAVNIGERNTPALRRGGTMYNNFCDFSFHSISFFKNMIMVNSLILVQN